MVAVSAKEKEIYERNRENIPIWANKRTDILDMLPRGGTYAELGVRGGMMSLEILKRCKPEMLHLIDCWEEQTEGDYTLDSDNVPQSRQDEIFEIVKKRFQKAVDAGRCAIHRMYTTDAINLFEDDYFDWIYIDADHSYKSVITDLRLYAPKVKADGYILGHDYVPRPGMKYGVIEAVEDFCKEQDWVLHALTREAHATWVIRRRVK